MPSDLSQGVRDFSGGGRGVNFFLETARFFGGTDTS